MRNIALVLAFVLCWVGIETERSVSLVPQSRLKDASAVELAQAVLHDYSDLHTARLAEQTNTTTTLSLRIPHKKGSSRLHTWLTMRPAQPESANPQIHGGYQCPKAVCKRHARNVLSRLCRLII